MQQNIDWGTPANEQHSRAFQVRLYFQYNFVLPARRAVSCPLKACALQHWCTSSLSCFFFASDLSPPSPLPDVVPAEFSTQAVLRKLHLFPNPLPDMSDTSTRPWQHHTFRLRVSHKMLTSFLSIMYLYSSVRKLSGTQNLF